MIRGLPGSKFRPALDASDFESPRRRYFEWCMKEMQLVIFLDLAEKRDGRPNDRSAAQRFLRIPPDFADAGALGRPLLSSHPAAEMVLMQL